MVRVAVLSTCALNQWALDYRGNYERIIESIQEAKGAGSRYRCGCELDITGYGCGDHYLEGDTLQQAWRVVASLLQHPACSDIMVDVGLPVMHKNVVYNCKLIFCNRKVVLVRPKMMLANDSHQGYQETRWFTAWRKPRVVEQLNLPPCITAITGQDTVTFGDAVVAARDTVIGLEICEELWHSQSPHVAMGLDGVEIVCHGSGTLQELGKANIGYTMVRSATLKSGGCYLYANQRGCDGSMGYFSGDACVSVNGELVGVAPLYSLLPVLVVTAKVDLDSVTTFRNSLRSRNETADTAPAYPRVKVDFWVCGNGEGGVRGNLCPSLPLEPWVPSLGQQVVEGAAVWAWDLIRRVGRPGVLLPLDGHLASSTTAVILATMCHKLVHHTAQGHSQVVEEVQRVVGEVGYVPTDAQELCGHLVCSLHLDQPSCPRHHAHLATQLAQHIGSDHKTAGVERGVEALVEAFTSAPCDSGNGTKTEADGGTKAEAGGGGTKAEAGGGGTKTEAGGGGTKTEAGGGGTKTEAGGGGTKAEAGGGSPVNGPGASNNVVVSEAEKQARTQLHSRLRMSLIYYFAEAGWWGRGGRRGGKLLVLASHPAHPASCVKFGDCYGDINLVGSFSKSVLREAILHARHQLNLPILDDILSSSLLTEEDAKDEEASEMVAKELLGPDSLLARLLHLHEDQITHHVEERVRGHYKVWGERRLQNAGVGGVPSCYLPGAGPSNPDRPLIYPPHWSSHFSTIDPWWKSIRRETKEEGIKEWCNIICPTSGTE